METNEKIGLFEKFGIWLETKDDQFTHFATKFDQNDGVINIYMHGINRLSIYLHHNNHIVFDNRDTFYNNN